MTATNRLWRPLNVLKLALSMPLLLTTAKLTELLIKLTREGRTPVFRRGHFPWEATLEAGFTAMRRELDAVLTADAGAIPRFNEVHPLLTVVDAWRSFMLVGYGHRIERNCAACPETAALLAQVPDLTTAMFSIFPPGTRLPRHRGIYSGVLRYHLGLRVPQPEACGMNVAGTPVRWREGEGFVFDNAYPHEAWNDGDGVRVILFLDFVRPLPRLLDRINRWSIDRISRTQFAKESQQNLDAYYAAVDGPQPTNA